MSQVKKILVAYDGSPHSKKALEWAIELSLLSCAQVAAVKVLDLSELYLLRGASEAFIQGLEEIRREDQKMMDEAVATGQNRGVKVTVEHLPGNIAREILNYAKQGNYDMIVTGTKGHGALEEMLMGSVTRNLVSLSHIPVWVVKD